MSDTEDSSPLPERRVVIIGARGDGKSSVANTILTKERFECGWTRTAQSEARHEIVEGRKLVVVDVPGWNYSPSRGKIPEWDKDYFKMNPSKCLPGPHAFLLIIAINSRFSSEKKNTLQEYMKLLGDRVWQHCIVLFTFGDYLGPKTIEQYIENQGKALKWLIEKCHNRYHVINNKARSSITQVMTLIDKIDEMVRANDDSVYRLDNHIFSAIKKKQEKIAKRAVERHRKALEIREQIKAKISENQPINTLQMVLLGSRFVGKTSVGKTILGIKDYENEEPTTFSYILHGTADNTEIAIVDTPGWRKGFPASDTPQTIKDEVLHSLFKCQTEPHVFLLVIDADASFNYSHLDAAITHVELLGGSVWKHTMVVFTRGDRMGSRSIEEYIEAEGWPLQSLVERCGNRYHVMYYINADDTSQVVELLEKIKLTLAGNNFQPFTPNMKILEELLEREKNAEKAALLRNQKGHRVQKGSAKKLNEVRILILGEKMSGKTTAANCILQRKVFPTQLYGGCLACQAQVAGRRVTVVDTPGWQGAAECTWEKDNKIVNGLTLSTPGFHAILFVISLDMKFNEVNKEMLVDHVELFGDNVWDHTMVLFSNVDTLVDRSLEEFIEREPEALTSLIDMCGNRYHCLDIKDNVSQHPQLFEKIEAMSAKNQGRLFHPNINYIHQRVEEKFQKRKIQETMQHRIEQGFRSRELELHRMFKKKLVDLQHDIKEIVPLSLGSKGKGKKKCILTDIEEQITQINTFIMNSLKQEHSSMDYMPFLSGSTQSMDKILHSLSMNPTSSNLASDNISQHPQLFEKIEAMSAKNQGPLFHPDINDIHQGVAEKFQKRTIQETMQHIIRSRELELHRMYKQKFVDLQQNGKEIVPSLGPKGEGKKKCILTDIEEQISQIDAIILQSSKQERSSMDISPNLSGSTQSMDKILHWLSMNPTSSNSASNLYQSQSSGFSSQINFGE
ncbi:GTPase IMAP family member 8-like isoform X1 [Stigmatopora argus]